LRYVILVRHTLKQSAVLPTNHEKREELSLAHAQLLACADVWRGLRGFLIAKKPALYSTGWPVVGQTGGRTHRALDVKYKSLRWQIPIM